MRLLTLTLLGTTLLLGCGNHNESPAETHHHTAMAAKSANANSDRTATCESCKAASPCTRPSEVNTWVNQHSKDHPDHNKYKFEDCTK